MTDRASRAGRAEQRGEGNRFQIRGEGLEVGIHGRGGNLTLPAPTKWGAVPACPQQGGLADSAPRSAPDAQGRPAGQGVRASPRRPAVTLQESSQLLSPLPPLARSNQDIEFPTWSLQPTKLTKPGGQRPSCPRMTSARRGWPLEGGGSDHQPDPHRGGSGMPSPAQQGREEGLQVLRWWGG